MRKIILALVAAVLAVTTGTTRAETSAATVPGNAPSVILDFGFGLPIYSNEYTQRYNSGSIGWSMNADALSQIGSSPFLWGLDLGLNFWGFNNTPSPTPGAQYTHSAIGISPLITILYRFDTLPDTQLRPRFGLATGPSLYIQRNRYTNPTTNQADSNSDTSIRWQTMARPGLEYQFADSLSLTFEAAFGLVSSDFIVQPELRMALLL